MLIDGIRGLDSQPNADHKRDNGEEHRHDADCSQFVVFLLEIGISPKEPERRNEKTHQIDGGLLAERSGQRPFLKFFAAVLAEVCFRYGFRSAVGAVLHASILSHIACASIAFRFLKHPYILKFVRMLLCLSK